MRAISMATLAFLLLGAGTMLAQTDTAPPEPLRIAPQTPWQPSQAGGRPQFEVATVKPSDPDKCCARFFSRNGRHFATTNTNLKYLIQWAWNLQAKQVVGGPPWMDVDRFDLAGEMDGAGAPNDHEWKEAVQQLLIDRFHIQMHHEKQEMTAFALTVEKGGPKLTPGDGNLAAHQSMGFSGNVGQTMFGHGTNASIADFIGELQRIVLDRPIVDQTGLTGVYDIQFQFTREEPNALGMTQIPETAAPNLYEALQQQLGLKLVGTKTPVDVIVIDHAEPPGDN